jgi:hypothetical protein
VFRTVVGSSGPDYRAANPGPVGGGERPPPEEGCPLEKRWEIQVGDEVIGPYPRGHVARSVRGQLTRITGDVNNEYSDTRVAHIGRPDVSRGEGITAAATGQARRVKGPASGPSRHPPSGGASPQPGECEQLLSVVRGTSGRDEEKKENRMREVKKRPPPVP